MAEYSPERIAQSKYLESKFQAMFPHSIIHVQYDDDAEEISVVVDKVEFVMPIGSDDDDYTFHCRISLPFEPDPDSYNLSAD